MKININKTTPEEYIDLSVRSDLEEINIENVETALGNSLYTVGLYDEEKLVGFGRVCGDQSVQFVICDVMVDKGYKNKGIDFIIMKEINEYLSDAANKNSHIFIITDSSESKVFEKFGFKYLDGDFKVAMYK